MFVVGGLGGGENFFQNELKSGAFNIDHFGNFCNFYPLFNNYWRTFPRPPPPLHACVRDENTFKGQ